MLLFPKKTKFSKSFSSKKIIKNKIKKHVIQRFSNTCLIACEPGIITNFQIESVRRFLRRYLKKKAQIFFRIFPNIPITKKPNEVRLGRGKGPLKYWAFFVKKGSVILEVKSFNDKIINYYLNSVRVKLAIKTFVYNRKTRWIF